MIIKITDCTLAPKWETLQTMVRESIYDKDAVFTKINRKDSGCNYRSPGEYELELRKSNGTVKKIDLSIENSSSPPNML